MTQSKNVYRTVEALKIGFNAYSGKCRSLVVYDQFTLLEHNLTVVGSGRTGGSHGTDQGYQDFKINEGEAIRKIDPGVMKSGYLELVELMMKEEDE